jgi:hypothetical protein
MTPKPRFSGVRIRFAEYTARGDSVAFMNNPDSDPPASAPDTSTVRSRSAVDELARLSYRVQ